MTKIYADAAWSELAREHSALAGGRSVDDSRSSTTPEIYASREQFEPIDWSSAAPSWASIFTGIVLPILAVIALTLLLDGLLCWVFEPWVARFWTVPLWLVGAMALPFASVGAITLTSLILKR